jgi:transposase
MAKPGPRKIYRYGDEFKTTAVRLSQMPGVAVKDVAASLDIHSGLGFRSPIQFERQSC